VFYRDPEDAGSRSLGVKSRCVRPGAPPHDLWVRDRAVLPRRRTALARRPPPYRKHLARRTTHAAPSLGAMIQSVFGLAARRSSVGWTRDGGDRAGKPKTCWTKPSGRHGYGSCSGWLRIAKAGSDAPIGSLVGAVAEMTTSAGELTGDRMEAWQGLLSDVPASRFGATRVDRRRDRHCLSGRGGMRAMASAS
jgi:hypothetical protein